MTPDDEFRGTAFAGCVLMCAFIVGIWLTVGLLAAVVTRLR